MLDEEDPPLPQPSSDTNSYTLGRTGKHNVVVTSLPAGLIGTAPAVIVATHMHRTFEKLRGGLMVGIGGGVPMAGDIRLGDVVISMPNASNGGIVQYDFGKHVKNDGYIRTGSCNTPPLLFLTALSRMQAKFQVQQTPTLSERLESIVMQKLPAIYGYPDEANDRLFLADYDLCRDEPTCTNCDSTKLISRPIRRNREIVIHHCTIASGNSVIKSGATRDRLAKSHLVKCFEMEAAGINALPYLIVRGISDYSDSHKNKRWRQHATLCAAICAKELLDHIASEHKPSVDSQRPSYPRVLDKCKSLLLARTN